MRRLAIFAAVAMVLSSCQLLLGIDTNQNLIDDADAATSVTGADAGNDAATDAASDVDAFVDPCPVTTGGVQVPVGIGDGGHYCIDRFEVTRGGYRQFLAAKGNDTSGQRADCTGNASFAPGFTLPDDTSMDQLPINQVDFCDAIAFCDWAGKRLCGAIDGGPLDFDAGRGDPNASQWYRACSNGNDHLHAYPYGNTFNDASCNAAHGNAGILLPVGSFPDCEGGVDGGLFDMSGNVAELEDSCFTDGGRFCSLRGGSFSNGFTDPTRCLYGGVDSWQAIDQGFGATGFRCCSR